MSRPRTCRDIAIAAEEFNDGESDGVGTPRGAGGEDAVRAIIDGRRAEQIESLGAVEYPEDEQVGEALDVGEAGGELRQDFEDAFRFVFGAGAFGDLFCVLVRASDVADGLGGEHWELIHSFETVSLPAFLRG